MSQSHPSSVFYQSFIKRGWLTTGCQSLTPSPKVYPEINHKLGANDVVKENWRTKKLRKYKTEKHINFNVKCNIL